MTTNTEYSRQKGFQSKNNTTTYKIKQNKTTEQKA